MIKLYYTDDEISGMDESSLKLHWWNGSAWAECSDSGVNMTDINSYSGYIWARIRDDTTPTLDNLTGTPFSFVILKFIALVAVLFLIDKYSDDKEFSNYIKLIIGILGAATGIRGFLRLFALV